MAKANRKAGNTRIINKIKNRTLNVPIRNKGSRQTQDNEARRNK